MIIGVIKEIHHLDRIVAIAASVVTQFIKTLNSVLADLLRNLKQVIVVLGYGMAVTQAKYIVNEFTENLRKRNINVKFAIRLLAWRLPGHMNVLLAEANLPYDIVYEMDEINSEFKNTDLVLVIGENDIVIPGTMDD